MRVGREGHDALQLRRVKLGHAGGGGCGRAEDRLAAALADGAYEPRGLPGALPGPVLLEVVLARLVAAARDAHDGADEAVEHGVDKDAAGRMLVELNVSRG